MRLFVVFLFSVLPLIAHSQYAESIRTGRPGIAMGPFTAGKKVLQVQSGVSFGKSDFESTNYNKSILGIAVIRYGIWEKFEINGAVGYSHNKITSENEAMYLKGLSVAQAGFRVLLRDGHGSGPNIGFQSRLKLNVLAEDFEQKNLANVSLLAVSQKLGQKIGLLTNLGITWSGNESTPSTIYALNLNMPVGKRISVFIENYGSIYQQDLDTRFDTGIGFLINSDLQLDCSFGYGKNELERDYFADFGISWRSVGNRN